MLVMRTYMKRTMSCALVLLMLVGMLGAMALPVAAASKITGVKVVAENAAEYAYSNGTVPYPSSM